MTTTKLTRGVYYISRATRRGEYYWTGRSWSKTEAYGYTSHQRALVAARGITHKALAFQDEITINFEQRELKS